MALRADGSVVVFGYDVNGQLTPPTGLAGVSAVAAGISHCLAITPAPQISSQPPASLELPLGSTTNLSVSISAGTTPQLQWSFDAVPIPNATLNTLTITNFTFPQARVYALSISNQNTHH